LHNCCRSKGNNQGELNEGTVALVEQLELLKILLKLARYRIFSSHRRRTRKFQPAGNRRRGTVRGALDSPPCGLNTFVFCAGKKLETATVCSSASEMDQYRLIVSITLPIAPALGFNTSTRDVKRLAAMR
jgi:hypothetical protein